MVQAPIAAPHALQPGIKVDLSYSLISLGSTAVWGVLGGWLLYFYLPPTREGGTALVPATLYGATMLLLRAGAAMVTPAVGFLSDRTQSRWGRRLPYMFLSAIPLLAAFVLVWTPPVRGTSVWNLVYLAVTMGVYQAAYILNQVPHMALLPEIAITDDHRVRVSGWAAIMTVLGMIAAGAAGPLIERFGFVRTSAIYAMALLPAFYLPFLVLRERPVARRAAGYPGFWRNLASLRHNRAFVVMTATGACYWGILSLVQSLMPYIVTEVCRLSEADTLLFYIPAVLASLICYPIVTALARRWGKWRVFAGSLLTSAAVLPGLALIGEWLPVPLIVQGLAWVTFQAVALSGVVVLPRVFGAEIVDLDEKLTGLRREGTYYATWGVLDQVVNAVTAAALPLLLLLGRSRLDTYGPLGVRMGGLVGGALLFAGFLIFLRYPLRGAGMQAAK